MLAAILCVIALVAAPVVANEAWQVTTWTTGEALPQGVVDAVHQTRDGYIWFTTLGGLVRYDGVAFTVFEKATTPGLRSNRFVNLLETPDGTLWAGTEDGFVTSDRNGRFSTRSVDGTINPVLGIAAAGSQPWVVTPRGRFRFDGQRFVPAGEAPTTLRFLYMTGSAVVTHDGVVVLRPAEPPKVLPFPGLVGEVAATVRADAGGWWIADRRGVFRYSAGELQQVDAPRLLEIVRQATRAAEGREALGAITRTRDGAFWISQSGRGVARVDGDSVEWITPQDGLASTDASRIYEDHDGTIWVTTLGGGVSAIHRRPARTYAAAAGLSPPDAYPILPWKGGLLVGSWGGGVYQFDGKQFTHATPSSGFVMSMADGGDGTLWVSTRGVWRIHGREVRHFDVSDGLPSDIVPVIYRARDGRMWFGTIAGLASLGANDRFTTHRMPSPATNAIRTIAEERDGSLLLGTRGGLLRFRDGHATLLADERSGLSSELVRAIRVEPDGTIWFGTYDGGLNRLRNGKLSVITTRQGLFDNGVFSIVKDRGFFWMSSNRGVHRASIRELNAVADGRMAKISPLAVTHADGLLSPECNGGVQPVAARTPDGRLWFPTQNGIAAIDPRLVPADLPPPPILMSGISVDGEPVQPAGEVRISSKSRRVEFRFAAPSTRPSVVTRYRYQLEGFDRGWNEIVGERVASYTALPPGRYRFIVSASNGGDRWSTQPAAVSLRVLPPFWRTWWFVTAAAMAIVGILAAVYRTRIRAMERDRAAQADFSRRLLIQQEEERKRVASELHDSLGQRLLIIKNRALLGIDGSPGEQLEEISSTASLAIDEVRRIAHNLRPVELDHLGLTRSLEVLLERMSASSAILFSGSLTPVDRLLTKDAEVNVFRIVQEWLSNIARHSQATAAVVSLERNQSGLRLRIRDDGSGFSAAGAGEEGRSGMGLRSVAERVEMLRGRYDLRSTPGEGTTMTIEFPVKEAEE